MTAQAQQIIEQAMNLPPEERQLVACKLLGSLPPEPVISESEIAKAREISRRYHAGEEKWISGEEFKAHLNKWIAELSEKDQSPGVV